MTLLTNFVTPVLMTGIFSALAGTGLQIFYGSNLNTALSIGVLIFCVLLSLIGFVRLSNQAKRLARLEEGIRSHEKRINKKLDTFAATIPSASKIERLERKISVREKSELADRNADNISARLSNHNEDTNVNKVQASLQEADGLNVVPLRPHTANLSAQDQDNASTSDDASDSCLEKLPVEVKRGFSPDGMHIRLQPAISLETQEVFAFEASVCVTSRYGELHDDATVRTALVSNDDHRGFDKYVMGRVISLVRSLRRQGKSPLVFVGISHATIKSRAAFEEMEETLKAQQSLNNSIVIEIPHAELPAYSKNHQAKLRQLRELGFSLCISQCKDQDDAADSLEIGIFDFVKMPVTELEKIEASALTKPESEVMVACSRSKAKLIVTGVERERQAVHLIDHNIQYAQGNFFSPPKFPATGQAGKKLG